MAIDVAGPTRKPCLLSEFGEGYCRWCHFVVGLTRWGVMARHYRGRGLPQGEKHCPGSLKAPAKRTPYSSRKAAFRVTPRRVWCEECRRDVPTTYLDRYWVYDRHRRPAPRLFGDCPHSWRAVPES